MSCTCLAWSAAAFLWLRLGERAFAVSVFGLSLSPGPCLAAYALVPGARKQAARRVVLFTGGLSIMAFSLLGAANMDLEGFFMLLLTNLGLFICLECWARNLVLWLNRFRQVSRIVRLNAG